MMILLVLLGAGFSIGAALLIITAFATAYKSIVLPWQSRLGGYAMLLGLATTQLFHARALLGLDAQLVTRNYVLVILVQSIGFYWFFLGFLRPELHRWNRRDWLILPIAIACAVLLPPDIALSVTMIGATIAATRLGYLVHKLRAQRKWFVLEFRVLALFALMAVLIAVASLIAPAFGWQHFASAYSALISVSFGLVLYLLLRFPDLAGKAQEAVATTYAVSTLSKVDCDNAAAELRRLFEQEKIYADENLSLTSVAEMTKLSSHQLSELINTQFEMGFSRLVRHYRIEAAKKMLIDEPRASVLSVGLSVGFTSQSNFYVAFKEFTGIVPGQFRKQASPSGAIGEKS